MGQVAEDAIKNEENWLMDENSGWVKKLLGDQQLERSQEYAHYVWVPPTNNSTLVLAFELPLTYYYYY